MNDITDLIKNTPKSSLAPFSHVKKAIYEPESGLSPDTELAGACILAFPASRTTRNTFLSFVNYLSYGNLLQQPKWTKLRAAWKGALEIISAL